MTHKPKTIAHVITGLGDAGAEGALYRLVKNDPSTQHHVISLTGHGKYVPMLEAIGVHVHLLSLNTFNSPLMMARLVALLKTIKPDLVQTWMYEADVFGGTAAKLASLPVVWSIRFSSVDLATVPKSMALAIQSSIPLSHVLPNHIISCGYVAMQEHIDKGYTRSGWSVVQNGFDFHTLTFDANARTSLRANLGLSPNETVLGMVARFDPQKDHDSLFQALAKMPTIKLLLAGRDTQTFALKALAERYGVEHQVMGLGNGLPITSVYSAIDIHVLASRFGEGFPNVVAESMGCGCISISTNSGDARYITDAAHIVPMRDSEALYQTLQKAVDTLDGMNDVEKMALRDTQRAKVLRFDIKTMVEGFHAAWEKVLKPTGQPTI